MINNSHQKYKLAEGREIQTTKGMESTSKDADGEDWFKISLEV